jgi:hypothetical protein
MFVEKPSSATRTPAGCYVLDRLVYEGPRRTLHPSGVPISFATGALRDALLGDATRETLTRALPHPTRLIMSLLAALMIVSPTALSANEPPRPPASVSRAEDKPEYAPIVERELDFYVFNYQTVEGVPFALRDYAKGKRLLIIEYFAGWCPNSNRNGHIVERLWNEYRDRGLGVVGVGEYSDADEMRIHIGRIGIDYPVVIETGKRDQRKHSWHYKYRRAVGDKRKWGTPFYVIIEARDLEDAAPKGLFARHLYTVSGEMEESEANQFILERIAGTQPKVVSKSVIKTGTSEDVTLINTSIH